MNIYSKKNRILIFDVETTGLIPKKTETNTIGINTNETKTNETNNNEATTNEVLVDKNPYITQFSFILFNTLTKTIERKYNYYIKIDPNIVIDSKITELTGIDQNICQTKGVDIIHVLDKFHDAYMLSDTIIAHNYEFDRNMIEIEINRNKNIIMDYHPSIVNIFNKEYEKTHNIESFCTMKFGTNICNIMKESKTGKLYKKFPTLLELHEFLFNEKPTQLHNSLMDIIVCLRCYLKMRHILFINNENFAKMIKELFHE